MVAGRIGARQRQLGYGHRPHRPARRRSPIRKLYNRADGVQVSNFQTRDGTYSASTRTRHRPPASAARPCPATRDTTGFPPINASRQRADPDVAPCYRRGARREPDGFYDLCRHALCADRRPVPHPELRPQAPRLCRGRAVGEPRPARTAHRPVPAFARERELGANTRSRRARTFRNTTPSRPAACRTATARHGPAVAQCRGRPRRHDSRCAAGPTGRATR